MVEMAGDAVRIPSVFFLIAISGSLFGRLPALFRSRHLFVNALKSPAHRHPPAAPPAISPCFLPV
jgi:hypothetical protein